ncbi:MAG: translocation/assembly module TamB, partial [Ignavibacteria bacterium]|nr:translocation/assembly module TamB [Ignavibacteria bacterium]
PLLRREIIVRSFLVDSPVLNLSKMPDSTLNIVYAAGGEPADVQEGQKETTGWILRLDTLVFRGIHVSLAGDEEPMILTGGQVIGAVRFNDDSLHIPVDSLSFLLRNPDLEVRHGRFAFTKQGEQISVRNLLLETRENAVQGELGYDLAGDLLSFDCSTEEVHVVEFIPGVDPRIANHRPVVSAAGWFRDDSLASVISIKEGPGLLHLDGTLGSISEVPVYNIEGSLRGFDLSEFVEYPFSISSMQADFALRGKGFDPGAITLDGMLDLTNTGIGELTVHQLKLSLQVLADDLRASFVTRTSVGSASMRASVLDYTGERLYTLSGKVADLNLAPFVDVSTSITGMVESNGRIGRSLDSMVVDLSIDADSILIDTLRIDRIRGQIGYHAGVLTADSVHAEQGETILNCSGVVDTAGYGSLQYNLQIGRLAPLATMTGFDSLGGTGVISGTMTKEENSLHLSAAVAIHDLLLNNRKVGDLGVRISAGMTGDSLIVVEADTVKVVLNGQTWENGHQWILEFDDEGVAVEYFGFRSGGQLLEVHGVFRPHGENDFTLMISQLDLSPILFLVTEKEGSGVLDADVTVTGSLETPQVSLTAQMKEGTVGELKIPDIDFTAGFRDSLVDWKILLARKGGVLTGSGSIPVYLRKEGERGMLDPGRPLQARLETKGFDLGSLPVLAGANHTVQGVLDAGIELGGTVHNPDIHGSISLREGRLTLPRWGVEYTGIRFALEGDGRGMRLDSLSVAGGEGSLDGSGMLKISYEDSLLIQPDFRFTAKDFDVLTGSVYFATIDGQIDVSGERFGRIILDGDITVKRSRISIQNIKGSGPSQDLDPPLLMIASGRTDTSAAVRDSAGQVRLPPFTGTMKVSIPRATWLRGPRLNMELSGDVTIISTEEFTAIQGFLSIEQGTYEFYGRKFVVVSGRVDFEDTKEFDPVLFVEVEYLFDTDGTDNRLTIIVRGRSSDPHIEFFHNRSPISESDAISYIVFGRKADDLNYGQKSTVSDLGNALAMDLAANMINSQLSSTLGSALGLDVVRISGEDNWNKAVLTAGKYVTNDVFVAYERGISQSGSSGVSYESARLEYYLFRFLYVQLKEATDKTSGVDLFLKFD